MAAEKNKAIKEAEYLFANLEKIKEAEKSEFYEAFSSEKIVKIIESKKIGSEAKLACISALNSLSNLAVKCDNFGILAGLPWFFQAWSRDEAVSLKALEIIDSEFAKNIIIGRLEKIPLLFRIRQNKCRRHWMAFFQGVWHVQKSKAQS